MGGSRDPPRSLTLAAAGIGAGTILAAAALRVMDAALEPRLPAAVPILALTATALALIVLAACVGPALRAARTDASTALREG